MQIKIPLPQWVLRTWDKIGDWLNIPLWRRGKLELRIIDIIMVIMFIVCVSYYYHVGGWLLAAQGGAMFIFVSLVALWILR